MSLDDVKLAWAAVSAKHADYNENWNYYDGNHPIEFSSTRIKKVFNGMDVEFHENWCVVVIDAVTDRMILKGAQVKGKPAQKKFDKLWATMNLSTDADDVHESALVSGEGCLLIWKEEDQVDVYNNDSRMVHVEYDQERPKVKRFAAKFWQVGKEAFAVLYYPRELEYYKGKGEKQISFVEWKSPAQNEHGIIPVFQFKPEGRIIKSDLNNAIPVQRSINKMVADLVVTSEFVAFPQRVVVSNADLSELNIRPHELWPLPAGTAEDEPTQFGSFPNADLEGFIQGLEHLIAALSAVTRTPTHHFFRAGSQVSGEALELMEAPLVRKVEKRQERFSSEWSHAFSYLLKLHGFSVAPADIIPIWATAGSLPEKSKAEIRKTNKDAGLPLITQLRDEGKGTAYLEQVEADIQGEMPGTGQEDQSND